MAEYLNVHAILRKHGLRPKSQWGQNFLVDVEVLESIADAARLSPGRCAVDLGAGIGALTAMLARRARKVAAVERDRDLAKLLRREFAGDEGVEIIEDNAATLDFAALAERLGDRPVLVGNLPYHMATRILFHLLDARDHLRQWVLMFQKEMADRLVAGPGGRDYGILGVLIQQHTRVERVMEVGPQAFSPAPKVRSSVLRFVPRAGPRVPVISQRAFERVVRGAFGQRRKKLRNSLRAAFDRANRDDIEQWLERAGLDGDLRAEQLTMGDFGRLADVLVAIEEAEASLSSHGS